MLWRVAIIGAAVGALMIASLMTFVRGRSLPSLLCLCGSMCFAVMVLAHVAEA